MACWPIFRELCSRLTSEADEEGESMNNSKSCSNIAFAELPSSIVYYICQLLIDCDRLDSILSFRACNKKIYDLINGLHLILRKEIVFLSGETDDIFNFMSYCSHVAVKTNWKFGCVIFGSISNWVADIPQYELLVLTIIRFLPLFTRSLKKLIISTKLFGQNIELFRVIVDLICTDRVNIELYEIPICIEDFELFPKRHQISCLQPLLDDSALQFPDNPVYRYCPNLTTFKLIEASKMTINSISASRFGVLILSTPFYYFDNLNYLELVSLDVIRTAAPKSDLPWFPRVEMLKIAKYNHLDLELPSFLKFNFPSVKVFNCNSLSRTKTQRIEQMFLYQPTNESVMDFLPISCSTLRIDAHLYTTKFSNNIEELCVLFQCDNDQLYRDCFDLFLRSAKQANLSKLNIIFSSDFSVSDLYGNPLNNKKTQFRYPAAKICSKMPFKTSKLLDQCLVILQDHANLEVLSVWGVFWTHGLTKVSIDENKKAVERWTNKNRPRLTNHQSLKYFAFGSEVVFTNPNINESLLRRMSFLDFTMRWCLERK